MPALQQPWTCAMCLWTAAQLRNRQRLERWPVWASHWVTWTPLSAVQAQTGLAEIKLLLLLVLRMARSKAMAMLHTGKTACKTGVRGVWLFKGGLDFTDNLYLLALKQGVKLVVWECDLNSLRSSWRTVLNPIDNNGHELFLEWIGASSIVLFSVLLIYFWHVIPFHREHLPCRRKTKHHSACGPSRAGCFAL